MLQLRGTLLLISTLVSAAAGSAFADPSSAGHDGAEYITIPAAPVEALTAAADWPPEEVYRTWTRSQGDAASSRYSTLNRITLDNVADLQVAWTYRSGDKSPDSDPGFSIQATPIHVRDRLIFPTPGNAMVAVDVETGEELWRFQPKGRPAPRGLTYWPGDGEHPERVLFSAGRRLYAVDPQSGEPIQGFGEGGSTRMAYPSKIAAAVYDRIVVIALINKDVQGFDVATGERLWRFHTIPHPGEYGYETWDPKAYKEALGANDWGGMAMDQARGIAYIATAAPKPNFIGVQNPGRNLFSDAVIALDARTGKRLWHFQEIRHDIWDLDIPAPPNLVTVMRDGKRVDAVAQVTKLGNTLLLDRVTGAPLYPFRLRKAPRSKLPGERTWPYQPALELPEPFSRQEFFLEDVTTRTPEARASVMKQLENANFGWFEPFEPGKPTVYYGVNGGGQWSGAAFDPTTGYLYVTGAEVPFVIQIDETEQAQTYNRYSHRPVPNEQGGPPTRGRKVYLQYCADCHGKGREGNLYNPALHNLAARMDDAEMEDVLDSGRKGMPPYPQIGKEDRQALMNFLFDRDQAEASLLDRLAHWFASLCPICEEEDKISYAFTGFKRLLDVDGYPGVRPPWGTLTALDLNTGRIVWQVPLGEYRELVEQGLPPTGTENYGGPIVTAGGLVFCAGTPDNKLRAFDKMTGEEVWSHELPYGGYAAPATYEVDGRQYLSIPANGGSLLEQPKGDTFVTFTLPPAP